MRTEKTEKKNGNFIIMVLFAFVVVLLIMNISCFIAQYENNYNLKKLNSELEFELNNTELLNVEYEKLTDYHYVEKYVTENLGMIKLNSYQTQYIVSTNTNQTLLIQTEEDGNGIFSRIAGAFSIALEYFN